MKTSVFEPSGRTSNGLELIYEDNHIISVVKPVNVLSQGDITGDASILELLKSDLKLRYNKKGDVFLGLLHRLDRPVGGTMVFAKTSKCASRISEQIRNKTFKKGYFAVAEGIFAHKQGELSNRLEKDEKSNKVFESLSGKECLLRYRVIGEKKGLSLVFVVPLTGRPHQIRAQLSIIGHPLAGDHKYGAGAAKHDGLALWSGQILLKHPTREEMLLFKSCPPEEGVWGIFTREIYKKFEIGDEL